MSKPKNNLIVGQLKPAILSYKWEIENFCTGCKKLGEYICSPKFSSDDCDQHIEWRLKIYPKGYKEGDKGYLSLFLVKIKDESNADCIVETIALSVLNHEHIKKHENILQKKNFNESSWGSSRFIHRNIIMDAKNGLLKDDTLTILCEIIFDPKSIPSTQNDEDSSDEESTSEEDKVLFVAKTYEANYKQEFEDFGNLLTSKTFSDVTITVGRKKIGVHKAILASRSPVFQAMFQNDMKESMENNVKITDIKFEVMEELLRFIYASRVNDIKSIAGELLVAAEKYCVSGLKVLCEKTLRDSLTVGNAVEYLNLSAACNTTLLKSQVIEFIVSNRKDIVRSPEFQSLPSDLMSQVVQAIVEDDESE